MARHRTLTPTPSTDGATRLSQPAHRPTAEEEVSVRFARSPPPSSPRPATHKRGSRSPSPLPPSSALAAGLALANAASVDALPKVGGQPRFPREVVLPAPPGYIFPRFSHFALYESSGAFREAFAARGYAACSVADRPTSRAPSPHCVHYIGSVQQFVRQYPHPLGLVVTHVTCTATTRANQQNWPALIRDGSMMRSAREFVWATSLGAYNASENPPGALEFLVGPPTARTDACEHGCPLAKQWCWWLRSLPPVPPSDEVPRQAVRNALSGLRYVEPEARMVLRSTTPPSLAAAHAAAWDEAPFVARVFTDDSPTPAADMPPAAVLDCSADSPLLTAILDGALEQAGVRKPMKAHASAMAHLNGAMNSWSPLHIRGGRSADERHACSTLVTYIRDTTAKTWMHANAVNRNAARRTSSLDAEYALVEDRLGVFAARYAPRASSVALASERVRRHVVVVPTAPGTRRSALVNLDGSCFAAELLTGTSAAERAEEIATFLPKAMKPILAAIVPTAPCHYVYLAPSTKAPLVVLSNRDQVERARRRGARAAWCVPNAGSSSEPGWLYPLYALQHIRSLGGPTTRLPFRIGIWAGPRPVLQARSAARCRRALPSRENAASWASMLTRDAEVADAMVAALRQADTGDGLLIRFADACRGIASYGREIPVPPAQFQDIKYSAYALALLPERPLPLVTDWLVKAPPQPLPPGYKPLPWSALVRGWARRRIIDTLNAEARREHELWVQGESGTARHPYLVLGPGAMKRIPHADGIGSWLSTDIIWKRDAASGLFHAMDFNVMLNDHKNREALWRLLGGITDKELLSLVFDGVRWKIAPPRQIRIANNLVSLDGHLQSVSASISKLVDKGLYVAVPLTANGGQIPDTAVPVMYHPTYSTGKGGVAKKDNPNEARPVGDSGAPHGDLHALNHPHRHDPGDAVAVSVNDMTGPTKAPPGYHQRQLNYPYARGYGPHALPWPDAERKMRPRHGYQALCVLYALANAAGLPVVGASDDVRWMFFQFYLAAEELWLSTFYMTLHTKQGLQFCLVAERVTNMGTRPMSKIACRFSEEFVDAWRRSLDKWIDAEWLPRQAPALKDMLNQRSAKLGAAQARPYWAAPFTDDIIFYFVGVDMAVAGLHLWTRQCHEVNLWMSTKKSCGTVVDWIGGRYVLTAGFGCLSPAKRARAVADSTAAIAGELTRDQLEAHNSFLVHVHDILDMPAGALQGLRSPLWGDAPGHCRAVVKGTVAEARHRDVIRFLDTVAAAPVVCAMPDADFVRDSDDVVWQRLASDACTGDEDDDDPARATAARKGEATPHVCGVADGIVWLYKLDTEWRRRHITVIEGVGPAGNVLTFAPLFPHAQLVLETDATAAAAAALWRARSADMQYLQRRLSVEPTYTAAEDRLWVEPCAGERNQLSDAGSRGNWKVLRDLAAAFSLRLRFIEIPPSFARYLDDVVRHTTPVSAPPLADGRTLEAIVASAAPAMQQYVANIDGDRYDVNVSANSGWSMDHTRCETAKNDGDRRRVVADTAAAMLCSPHRTAHVRAALQGLRLGCACAPKLCNAHAIALVANVELADLAYLRRKALHHRVQRKRAERLGARADERNRRRRLLYGGEADEAIRFMITPPITPEDLSDASPAVPRARLAAPPPSDNRERNSASSSMPTRRPQPQESLGLCVAIARLDVEKRILMNELQAPRDSPERAASTPAHSTQAAPNGEVSHAPNATEARLQAAAEQLLRFSEHGDNDRPSRRAAAAARTEEAFEDDAMLAPQVEDFVPEIGTPAQRRRIPSEMNVAVVEEDTRMNAERESGSPQPRTAAAARAAAARHLAQDLAADTSADAVCRGDPAALSSMCAESQQLLAEGIPKGTRKADEWGFKWVQRFCVAHDTRWMRPRVVEPRHEQREAWLAAFAIVWMAATMGASARREAQGYTQAKASSCLLALYAWRRVQRDCGRHVCDMRLALKHLKGLNAQYRRRWGDMALVPEKRKPFSLRMLNAMAQALRQHRIGAWTTTMHEAMLALVTWCLSTGMRRDEWSDNGDSSYVRRANFAWFKNKEEIVPDTHGLQAIGNGDFLRAKSNPSKCDRDNMEWGAKDMWFRVDSTNPLNFAAIYLEYERAYPCPPSERGRWAGFSPNGNAVPFTYAGAATHLQRLMLATLEPSEAACRSWHAFRVTIACALLAHEDARGKDKTEAVTQLLVRWKTTASVRCYYQMAAATYADYVDEVTRTDAHPHRDKPTCDIDASAAAQDLQDAVRELEADLDRAQPSAGKPRPNPKGEPATTSRTAPATKKAKSKKQDNAERPKEQRPTPKRKRASDVNQPKKRASPSEKRRPSTITAAKKAAKRDDGSRTSAPPADASSASHVDRPKERAAHSGERPPSTTTPKKKVAKSDNGGEAPPAAASSASHIDQPKKHAAHSAKRRPSTTTPRNKAAMSDNSGEMARHPPSSSPPAAAATSRRAAKEAATSFQVGGHAIMPSTAYPDEKCRENGGAGWTVKILEIQDKWATISFSQARDVLGRRFLPLRIRRALLTPLQEL
jgi:hypothetical protein